MRRQLYALPEPLHACFATLHYFGFSFILRGLTYQFIMRPKGRGKVFRGEQLGEIRKAPAFFGRIVMVGFGSIGQGTLPLLLRHIDLKPEQIAIITGDENGRKVAAEYGVAFHDTPLTPANYRALLEPHLGRGDFLVNCSNDVSSVALIALCQERGALYIDTCIEPWAGGYTDTSLTPEARSTFRAANSPYAARVKRSAWSFSPSGRKKHSKSIWRSVPTWSRYSS